MKPWMIRTSLALNLLVIAICVGVWQDPIMPEVGLDSGNAR
jgi:hypothetical protein